MNDNTCRIVAEFTYYFLYYVFSKSIAINISCTLFFSENLAEWLCATTSNLLHDKVGCFWCSWNVAFLCFKVCSADIVQSMIYAECQPFIGCIIVRQVFNAIFILCFLTSIQLLFRYLITQITFFSAICFKLPQKMMTLLLLARN